MMIRRGLLFVFFVVFGIFPTSQNSEARPWRESLIMALRESEAIRQYEAELERSRHNLGLARQQFWLPDINFSANGGALSEKRPSTGNEFQEEITSSFTTTISKSLYQGGVGRNAIRRSRVGVDIARSTLSSIEHQFIGRGLRSYVDLRYQFLLLSAQIRHQVFASERLEQIRLSQQGGARRLIDVWFAQLESQQSEQSSLAREALLDQSKAEFSGVFKFEPAPASLTPVDLPVNLLPDSFIQSNQLARENNPIYRLRELNVAFQEFAVREATAQSKPTISARLNAAQNNYPNVNVEEETVLSARIQIDWGLSAALQGLKRRAIAKSNLKSAQFEAQNFIKDRRVDFEREWNLLHNAARRYNRLAVAERANRELLLSQREQAELGNLTSSELLQVELQYLEHRIEFLDSERELFIAYINVLEDAGLLTRQNLAIET